MLIDEMKRKYVSGELELGLFTADNKIIVVDSIGFMIKTFQDNGWARLNIYEYIDNKWIESETYERGE